MSRGLQLLEHHVVDPVLVAEPDQGGALLRQHGKPECGVVLLPTQRRIIPGMGVDTEHSQVWLVLAAEPVGCLRARAQFFRQSRQRGQGLFGGEPLGEPVFLLDGRVAGQTGPANHCGQQQPLDRDGDEDDAGRDEDKDIAVGERRPGVEGDGHRKGGRQ